MGLSTVSETLDRLDELGYVSRTRSAHDRRAVEVRLTVKGDRAMRATSVLDADRLARVLASMPDGERWRAVAGLELLARAAVDVNKKGASGSKTASGRRAAGARPESKRGPRGTTRKGTR